MSKVKLSEFDLYGTFRLTKAETVGIENLVRKLGHNKYLSRNANYYHSTGICFREICDEYQHLNKMLPLKGKRALVICEKMHELAVRVVNTIQLQGRKINLFQNRQHYDTVAQKCVQECADNLVRLIYNQTAIKTTTDLHDEIYLHPDMLIDCHLIEANNLKQLFMCANALPNNTKHLITPGCGSSKLGSIVQSVRQHKGLKPLGFTQIAYSIYHTNDNHLSFGIPKNLPEKVLVMDDIIYRGETLTNIKKELIKHGHKVINGAITTSFYKQPERSIDIIPNQYARNTDQQDLKDCLRHKYTDDGTELSEILDGHRNPRNSDRYHTADYYAMRLAEKETQKLGADLYHVSEKISPIAVEYNCKIREQVIAYDISR